MSLPSSTTKITPTLWFDHHAEDAVQHYINLFNSSPHASESFISRVLRIKHYMEGVPHPCQETLTPGTVRTINFSLAGHEFMAMNAGPIFKFTPAVSLMVECEDQDEIDHFWAGFTEGKKERELNCGWVTDRWGLTWQVVPKYLRQVSTFQPLSHASSLVKTTF